MTKQATDSLDRPAAPLIDASLVSRLISGQFPQWEHLPVRPVEFDGSTTARFISATT